MHRRLLFVTWDGPGLTYLESLFLPIFVGLADHGFHTDILQFRWGGATATDSVAQLCRAAGCGYRSATVIRRGGGVGAFASALWGARSVRTAVRSFASDIVMPRSLMPALAVLAAGGPALRPMIFDADGLAADERVEFAGQSPLGASYRLLRDIEAQAVRRADAVITRSAAAADVLLARAGPPVARDRFHVVTNGRDAGVFTPGDAVSRAATRDTLGIARNAPLVVYAGSIGPQYRFDLLAGFMREARRRLPDTQLLVLSRDVEQARRELARWDADLARLALIRSAAFDAVPALVAAADLGVAFRADSFSTAAVAPVKLSEYLLCGVPVIGTRTIGDTAAALDAGVLFDPGQDPAAGAAWFQDAVLPRRAALRDAARQVGCANFSLTRSVDDYRSALGHVADRPRAI